MDRESTAGSKTQQGTGEEGERGGWGAGSSRLKDRDLEGGDRGLRDLDSQG